MQKIKKGATVNVSRAGKPVGQGRYVGKTSHTNGDWHQVNFSADKRKPNIVSYRAANITVV